MLPIVPTVPIASTRPSSSCRADLAPDLDPPVTQEGLIATQDAAPSSVEAVPAPTVMSYYRGISTIPSDADLAGLSRPFMVGLFTWNVAALPGSLVTTLNFPDLLMAIPFLMARLSYFRYFRAGVSITFRMATNKFLYGALLASWDCATSLDSSSSAEADLYTASGFPHVLIMANDATTQTITMPFLYPHPYLDVQNWRSGDIGSVDLIVAAPLRSSTTVTSTSLGIEVWANFVEPDVMAPTNLTVSTTRRTPVRRGGGPALGY